MERFQRLLQKLLFPKAWMTLLSVPLAAAGLIYVFTGDRQEGLFSYLIYAFSFCSLTWVCAAVCRSAGHWKQDVNALIDRVPIARRYLTDVSFHMSVSLYQSLGLNVLYAAAKLAFAVYYRSAWFATLAVYYFLLAVIRFALLHYSSRNAFGANQGLEWKRYRLCGILLLVMNAALTGMVILVVSKNEGFNYAGYLIYVMALYAFYNIAMAIRNVIKYRKYQSPVMSAAKVLQLAAALVSMLALETAMLAQFGENGTARTRAVMTGCTGVGVCAIILAIAVYMICRASKMLRMLQTEETV